MSSETRHWHATEDISANLRCAICTDAFDQPRRLSRCGHYFCRDCIGGWLAVADDAQCPVDRIPVSTASNAVVAPDRLVVALLDEIAIKCDYCGFAGRKAAHACPLFACEHSSCAFLASDRDELMRHANTCSWLCSSSSSSSSAARARKERNEDGQMSYGSTITEDRVTDLMPKMDNVVVGGLLVAAGVIGGLILGRNLNKRDK
ncbi:hypothetical protein HDU78_006825 [Chytriomyces hyalinus]|uniref:RING-type domain-containing protein n=1 Tax=Chytriomyces confervae TaxID=246404 RepID=A0A507FPS5_9FUNG|nr:hypothetical protein HDU78_006825 [Chytriomyces hyalinus]KAJ3263386.1 hypothetical protein HDU77_010754 [Chytriomyces hyalinus]KAJ3400812.1 hypothetical protein HDU80_006591 [Chytriomyces hyalinus]TPX77037.1 hypothetical protein CcCBS67573_g01713 [Chytriomyces confervae]